MNKMYKITLVTFSNAVRYAMLLVAKKELKDNKLIKALNSCVIDNEIVNIPDNVYRTVKSASYGFKMQLSNNDTTAIEINKKPVAIPNEIKTIKKTVTTSKEASKEAPKQEAPKTKAKATKETAPKTKANDNEEIKALLQTLLKKFE